MTTEKKGKNGKGEKAAVKETLAVKKAAAMAHGEVQSKDSPPNVAKGFKAIWHAPYSYDGKNGKVTVRGHWEVAKEAEPKKIEK